MRPLQDFLTGTTSPGSIHFSLLSGRILLKDVYYHSSNQTINVVKAQITWRYWLRATTTDDDLAQEHVGGEDCKREVILYPHKNPQLTYCKSTNTIASLLVASKWPFTVSNGFFTTKLRHMIILFRRCKRAHLVLLRHRHLGSCSSGCPAWKVCCSIVSSCVVFIMKGLPQGLYPPASLTNIKAPPIIYAALNWIKCQMPYIDSKDLLPISIVAFKCAIVCGNASTPTLMVAECHSANGTFGIVPVRSHERIPYKRVDWQPQARSRCDLYKQLLNLRIQNTVIHLVGNPSYHGAMPDTGHSIRVVTEASR